MLQIQSVILFLVHDSFTSLIMMQEERELERGVKVKVKF